MSLKRDSLHILLLYCTFLLTPVNAETIKIEAGEFDRTGVPVSCPVPESIPNNHPFILISNDTNERIPTQIDRSSDHPTVTWMLEQPLYSGQSRSYRMVLVDGVPKRIQRVTAEQKEGAIKISLGEKPIFMCRFSSEAKATEVEVIRRGYVSPIIFRIQAIILEVHAPVKAKLHGFITLSRESNSKQPNKKIKS